MATSISLKRLRHLLAAASAGYIALQSVEESKRRMDQLVNEVVVPASEWERLSFEEAIDLGFQKWSEETPNFLLIPTYLWRFIPVGLKLTSVNGNLIPYTSYEKLDNDSRCGALAYGLTFGEKK